MSASNPWLTHPAPAPTPQVGAPQASPVTWAGPVVLRGAHGGAGVSTLGRLLPGAVETHFAMTHGERILLVCRSHVSGLLAAQRVLAHLAGQQYPAVVVAGLVVNADAPGRAPRPLADLARLVGGGAPRVWHLPWVEAWRLTEIVAEIPRPVERVLREMTHELPGLA